MNWRRHRRDSPEAERAQLARHLRMPRSVGLSDRRHRSIFRRVVREQTWFERCPRRSSEVGRSPGALDRAILVRDAVQQRSVHQAARTVARKWETCPCRSSDCRESSEAADRTCPAAAPVYSAARATPITLRVTSPVPAAASLTFRTISCVAAPCSSTAAAMEFATSLISRMRIVMPPMAVTA